MTAIPRMLCLWKYIALKNKLTFGSNFLKFSLFIHGELFSWGFFFRFTDILTFCSVNAPQDASYEICEIIFRCRVNQWNRMTSVGVLQLSYSSKLGAQNVSFVWTYLCLTHELTYKK